MNQSSRIILEIAVDRQNEKGVFVAKEMLSTLHHVLYSTEKNIFTTRRDRPEFRFFMVYDAARIRFFFDTPEEHRVFLESQLYAHYSNIEISESSLPFENSQEFYIQKAHLSKISDKLIKLYVNFKDRIEKETIDPISSITSVLSHATKDEVAFFRVDFTPLEDENFREGIVKKMAENHHYSDGYKLFRIHQNWWLKWIIFPFSVLASLARMFAKKTTE